METIAVTVPLAARYQNEFINIEKTSCTIALPLEPGSHTAVSDPVRIGSLSLLNNPGITAQLQVSYEYDKDRNLLTLYGTTYVSEQSTRLKTYLEGTDEYCLQQMDGCYTGKNREQGYNAQWNYTSPLTPGLEEHFKEIIRDVNHIVFRAAKTVEGLTIRVKTPPPQLTQTAYKNLLLVYKNGIFQGLYDPEKHYDDNFTFKSIQSVWGGTVHFYYGENFANVIGSTPDPKIGGNSWLGLWRNQFGNPTICTSYQYGGFQCNNYLVGGHIILGKNASVVPRGSDSVYIMPICNAHNNNDNVYMAALQYLDGIWLKNYLN